MKKLLATMCAFALVIPCILGFAACKKDPIKVYGKTFAFDHIEMEFKSDEVKAECLDGRTEEEYIKILEENYKLSAYKFTKTGMLRGNKLYPGAKNYDFVDDNIYYKQSKGKITFYDDKDFKIVSDLAGIEFYTTSKYLIIENTNKEDGSVFKQYYKLI